MNYLRSVLVTAGALPQRDENVIRVERHVTQATKNLLDPSHRTILTRYANWYVLRCFHTHQDGPMSANVAGRCRENIDMARGFLNHVASSGYSLDDCPQIIVDQWLTEQRNRRIAFVRWLKNNGHLHQVQSPDSMREKDPNHQIDPDQQLALARHLLHNPDSASIEDRAAACLILLYAQPASKIITLTTDSVEIRDDDTYLHLGPEPLLLIPPLDTLIKALPVSKPFGTASTLADKKWLFTGKNAGGHVHSRSMMHRMNQLGIYIRSSRNTALLTLAVSTPPAVFASLIGINTSTATRWAALAGASWTNYAAIR
ncbi:hypothetical protein U6G28_06495 [Actinomycetaceae bacterium MB13-C1-2]|nr:hypothetical protein U6G28_06495 [Actinomycetaceae bacterium MB13-C1-2]